VPITSPYALTNATRPYVTKLADLGAAAALADDPGFMQGLNVAGGAVTYEPVALDQGLPFTPPEEALATVTSA
jgi:alanine dehydrogenase